MNGATASKEEMHSEACIKQKSRAGVPTCMAYSFDKYEKKQGFWDK